ncbi:HNH endonuclease-domain-containing protein [Lipomyces starkeyi]
MVDNRSLGRSVHFYNALSPDDALGGLILNQSVTEKKFLFMLEILIVASNPYNPGQYDIRSNAPGGDIFLILSLRFRSTDVESGTIHITDEPCITRVYSGAGSGRTEQFRNQVRKRDRKCVITGTVNTRAYRDLWFGFEAAHVFPLSDGQLFVDSGLSRWITNREGEHDSGINSCQNGLLMQTNIHQEFDSFSFSINPDDNYKIISFADDPFKIDGRVLDPSCRAANSGRSVRDELLRWHFRQAVLVNMRGAGEPGFEMDFPPGTDMMGEIFKGPEAAKRMEAELFLRLDGLSWQKGLSH